MSQWEPSFYGEAVRAQPEVLAQAGYELEQSVLMLHNEVVDANRWQTVITDEQINGWLAVDLPKKFPQFLSPLVKDPRVEIRSGRLQIACRYEGPKLSAVVSVIVEPFLTERPNVLAVRIDQARLGALPVLKKRLMGRISHEAQRMGIQLTWTQQEDDPVALVTVDPPADGQWDNLHLDFLELRDGELWIAGSTGDRVQEHEAG